MSTSNETNNNNLNSNHNKNTVAGDIQSPSDCKSDHPDQLIGSRNSSINSSNAEQFPQQYYNSNPCNIVQNEENINSIESVTPKRQVNTISRRRLFINTREEQGDTCNLNPDIVPPDLSLGVLLINSGKIDAIKVQTIVNDFLVDNDYASIFCMTETKVKELNFQPEGIKLFSKHRSDKDKKGERERERERERQTE